MSVTSTIRFIADLNSDGAEGPVSIRNWMHNDNWHFLILKAVCEPDAADLVISGG
jgi:hypothetical protein